MKQQIDQYHLGPLVPQAYSEGSDALNAGEQAIGTDNAAAKGKLDTAIADFQKVLSTGFPIALKQERGAVARAKSDADAAKAGQAAPDLYKQAESYEQQAAAKERAGSDAEAYTLYSKARSSYEQAASQAKQLRAEAEKALQAANEAVGQAKSQVESIQKNLETSLSQESASAGGGSSSGSSQSSSGGQ